MLSVVDKLAAEFPDVPWQLVDDKVENARTTAAPYLPNVVAYSDALERQARAELMLERTPGWRETSSGTSAR